MSPLVKPLSVNVELTKLSAAGRIMKRTGTSYIRIGEASYMGEGGDGGNSRWSHLMVVPSHGCSIPWLFLSGAGVVTPNGDIFPLFFKILPFLGTVKAFDFKKF